jgi:hypothetical protein
VVCDGSGFICRSLVFAGNAIKFRTLEQMLNQLFVCRICLMKRMFLQAGDKHGLGNQR